MDFDEGVESVFPHESFRPHQRETIRFIYDVMTEGRVGLLDAPCGVGKSVSALCAFLVGKLTGRAGRLLVVTRTKSQLEIYVDEIEGIYDRAGVFFDAVVLKSRRDLCALIRTEVIDEELSYHSFLSLCRELRGRRECPYYESSISYGRASYELLDVLDKMRDGMIRTEEIVKEGLRRGVCPYEAVRRRALTADVIIGSYNYLLMDVVRERVLGKGLSEFECVVDEAHTLPDYARDLISSEFSTRTLERAIEECRKAKTDPFPLDLTLEIFMELIEEAERRVGLDEERIVKRERVAEMIRERGGFDTLSDYFRYLEVLRQFDPHERELLELRLLRGCPRPLG